MHRFVNQQISLQGGSILLLCQLPGILQWPWEGLSEPHFALSETRQKGSFVSSISLCGDAHRQLSLTSSFKKISLL